MTEKEAKARAMYNAVPTPKTSWEDLGDVTRSVWLERVDNPNYPPKPPEERK